MADVSKDSLKNQQYLLTSAAGNEPADYALLENAYYGTGGFSDGSYIIKHPREKDDKYIARRLVAYYLNYMAPTVNAHVDPIFKEPAKREKPADQLFTSFFDDVDGNGTTLDLFMQLVALYSKLYGVGIVVVDNVTEQPATLGAAIAARAFPYCYLVNPGLVVKDKCKASKTGRLIQFAYYETDETDPSKNNVRIWTQTECYLTDEDGKEIAGSRVENKAKEVPVVLVKSRQVEAKKILPPSEFLPAAKTNFSLYQHSSWLTEIFQNVTFPVLTYPAKESQTLKLGTSNVLGYDGATMKNPPAFIAPSSDPATVIMTEIDNLVREIYRMAGASDTTGVKEAASGKAKEWDNETLARALATFARLIENGEKQIVKMFGAWTSRKDTKYSTEYPRKFDPVDIEKELKEAEIATALGFGDLFTVELAKKLIAIMFPKLTEPEVKAILEEIKQRAIDRAYAEKNIDDEDPEAIDNRGDKSKA